MADKTLDTLGLKCPMPVLKTKKELKGMSSGQTLEVIADDAGAMTDIPAMVNKTGNEVLEKKDENGKITILIKKA